MSYISTDCFAQHQSCLVFELLDISREEGELAARFVQETFAPRRIEASAFPGGIQFHCRFYLDGDVESPTVITRATDNNGGLGDVNLSDHQGSILFISDKPPTSPSWNPDASMCLSNLGKGTLYLQAYDGGSASESDATGHRFRSPHHLTEANLSFAQVPNGSSPGFTHTGQNTTQVRSYDSLQVGRYNLHVSPDEGEEETYELTRSSGE